MPKKHFRNALNLIRYGACAPAFGELIFVDPMQVNHYSFAWKQRDSGRVVGGNWDLDENLTEIESRYKFKACVERWKLGKTWEETGIYTFMLDLIQLHEGPVDKCSSLDDIRTRYERLDRLFENAKASGRLKTQQELNPGCQNEEGGIFIHIGRHNQVIFGGGGIHRLAIAKILHLRTIPAQLGVLHPEALFSWKVYKQQPVSPLILTK